MFYTIWITTLILYMSTYAWLCFQNNLYKTPHWFVLSWLITIIPVWSVVSKYSNNLLFDSLLYDVVMVSTYTLVTAILMKDKLAFTTVNWIGMSVVIVGFIMMKIKV